MYLYVLCGKKTKKYYIGVTDNIERRIIEHNNNKTHFTGKQHEIWEVIFTKYFKEQCEARKEEMRLKRAKNKKYLEWYMKS